VSDPATWTADTRPLLPGTAAGVALVLDQPLSFWGGVDPLTGLIIDRRHPQLGQHLAGRALVMPAGRGSSSSSTVLAECLRAGQGPAMIVLAMQDDILVLGALVIQLLDGLTMPIVVAQERDYGRLRSGDSLALSAEGRLSVTA
jgi:predicted aconitase with swiveling domain